MNWLFGAYSNVYKTAMMQHENKTADVKLAKRQEYSLASFMGRRWVD